MKKLFRKHFSILLILFFVKLPQIMSRQLLRTFVRTLGLQRNTVRCISINSTGKLSSNDTSKTSAGTDGTKEPTNPEIVHHERFSSNWWSIGGPMKGLHALNEIRVPFIRDGLVARGNVSAQLIGTTNVLQEQKILEVGCGGGILTEQLARLGATMTGIDLSDELISTARQHLRDSSPELNHRINYKIEPVEVHAQTHAAYYDAVILSEVIEHVDDKPAILCACVQTLKPGGSIFVTTLNKTWLMWISGIAVGEYVLGLVPKGTHHWDKLISPLDLQRILDSLNCQTVLVNGSTYDFWRNTWRWINTTSMCYALQAVKTYN